MTNGLPNDAGSIRRGCKARGWKLITRVALAPDWVEASETPGIVWINVGARTGAGIANFRTPGSGVRGSCECVVQSQSELFAHVFARWDVPGTTAEPAGRELEVTVCLPAQFKPDDASAAYLVQHLLEEGELPPAAPVIAAYSAWARRSSEPYFSPREESAAGALGSRSLKELIVRGWPMEGSSIPFSLAMAARQWWFESRQGSCDDGGGRLAAAASLIDLTRSAVSVLDSSPPRYARQLDPELAVRNWLDHAGGDVVRHVHSALQAVLSTSKRVAHEPFRAQLCTETSMGQGREVPALAIDCGDSVDPGMGNLLRLAYASGFHDADDAQRPAIVVLHGTKGRSGGQWYDVSLAAGHAAAKQGNLKGLGLALEALEQRRRSGRDDTRRALHGRYADIPGIADPWYDGRDHDFGLVGGPRGAGGSELGIEDIKAVLATPYWQPVANRVVCWEICQSSERPRRQSGPADAGLYRSKWCEPSGDPGREIVNYQPLGSGRQGRPTGFVLTRLPDGRPTEEVPVRLAPGAFADPKPDRTRVVLIDLSRPPFMPAGRLATIEECVPAGVRDSWRSAVCGPGSRAVELDTARIADVGPRGIVVWRRPGDLTDADAGRETALAAMDVLAYRSDLQAMLAEASEESGVRPGASSAQLENFVGIVRSYHPERATIDLRRLCEALEESLSIPTVIERLERFLQFSDERERIRKDGILQLVLLMLAVPAALQTPADLFQAWADWHATPKAAESSPWSIWTNGFGLWILVQLLVIAASGWVIYQAARKAWRWKGERTMSRR